MILIITNKEDYTADFAILKMKESGKNYFRLNTEDLLTKSDFFWGSIENGYIKIDNKELSFENIKSIWYRRPVPPIPSEEIQDPTLRNYISNESQFALEGALRTINCFWMSEPESIQKAEYKLYQLNLANKLGFSIPNTIVSNSAERIKKFYTEHNKSAIIKPLHSGQVYQDGKFKLIYTNKLNDEYLRNIDSVKFSPCLIQNYIEKKIELRVTIFGKQLFSIAIHSQENPTTSVDWRRPEVLNTKHEIYDLDKSIKNKCFALLRELNISFGAIDLIITPNDELVFLEINPNGQWAWLEQLTNLPLSNALINTLSQN